LNIIQAGHIAVEELIKVAKEAIVDSNMLDEKPKEVKKETKFRGFAEGRSK
jgi:hypothetical protein